MIPFSHIFLKTLFRKFVKCDTFYRPAFRHFKEEHT
jgi:hypothetical protein